jgi:hypothetical protein
MKNIIVVLSGLLIGYLEATAKPPTEVADPGSPASAGLRTASSSSVLAPPKTKPIYIAYELSFYRDFIPPFKTRVAASKPKDEKKLETEFSSILKSACYSDPSFLNEIRTLIRSTSHVFSTSKIIGWLATFETERDERLKSYETVITELFDRYDKTASKVTELSFIDILESATDNLDLKDIEITAQKAFILKKSTEEKADAEELDAIHSVTTECLQLFLTCLEPYKISTPTRSRTISTSAAFL